MSTIIEFKNVNFSLIILLYILCCLLWPIGFIVGLYDYYKMKNQPSIKRDEKENFIDIDSNRNISNGLAFHFQKKQDKIQQAI